jgi:hypothetical protein
VLRCNAYSIYRASEALYFVRCRSSFPSWIDDADSRTWTCICSQRTEGFGRRHCTPPFAPSRVNPSSADRTTMKTFYVIVIRPHLVRQHVASVLKHLIPRQTKHLRSHLPLHCLPRMATTGPQASMADDHFHFVQPLRFLIPGYWFH